jgi:diaminopimelate decarboxylase
VWTKGSFETLGQVYCSDVDVCILVYDVTNPRSLERLASLKRIYEEHQNATSDSDDQTVYAVFANKVPTTTPLLVAIRACVQGDVAHIVR